LPLVLDADGLNAFAGHYNELKSGKSFRVLTPHPGEAARLAGISTREIQANRLDVARRISSETRSCVVLEGSRTVVAGVSGETWVNMTGNPAMVKGGSGDVLSGIAGAALARQTVDPPPPADATGRPDLTPAKTRMHELYRTDSREKVREYQAPQIQRGSA